jgi:hypothetical protein
MNNKENQCDHLNLEKIEEDTKQGYSLFKCLDCGIMISKDKQLCTLCGDIPVDNITDHMLRVHEFDGNRWDAVTGLGDKNKNLRKDRKDLV